MGSLRTNAKASISVPIFASWCCSKCGASNSAHGEITVALYTTGKRGDELERAKKGVEETWKETALGILKDPVKFASDFKRCFKLFNTKCSVCGKREPWAIVPLLNIVCNVLLGLGFLPGIIAALGLLEIVLKGSTNSFGVTCIIVCGCIYSIFAILYGIAFGIVKKTTNGLAIGSLDSELIEFGEQSGYHVMSPEEVLSKSKSLSSVRGVAVAEKPSTDESKIDDKKTLEEVPSKESNEDKSVDVETTLERLERISRLKESGVISKEEFEKLKEDVLNGS